jgi:CheY-like chemotaxis protein
MNAGSIVLLDMHMPEMDGLAVGAWIREQAGLKIRAVLILSSGAMRTTPNAAAHRPRLALS